MTKTQENLTAALRTLNDIQVQGVDNMRKLLGVYEFIQLMLLEEILGELSAAAAGDGSVKADAANSQLALGN